MKARKYPALVFGLCFLSLAVQSGLAQGTAFTYQGQLMINGAAANGNYDLKFILRPQPGSPSQIGSPLTSAPTTVSDGLFTVLLDFGNVFSNSPVYLEISARTSGNTGAYSVLSPAQLITSAPFAVQALKAATAGAFGGVITDAQLSTNIARLNANPVFGGVVQFKIALGAFSGAFSGTFNGNASTATTATSATTAASFSGPLLGDVTGTQAATMVSHLGNIDAGNLTNLVYHVYNIRDYGAGTGSVAQDSAAIFKAFNAWTNTGGVLYFPPGHYFDTNQYVVSNARSQDNWEDSALAIVGEGSAATFWHFLGTNGTLLSFTAPGTPPQVVRGLTFIAGRVIDDNATDGNGGTNNGLVLTQDSGHAIWNDVRFENWLGYGVVWNSGAGGRFYGLQFLNCGTGISLYGYDDGTVLDVIGFGCTNAVVDIGQTVTWPGGGGISRVIAPQINIFGAGNQNAVIVGNGAGARISGYVEGCFNAIVQIGHAGGADTSIQTVTISELGGLQYPGEYLCKLYSPCDLLTIRNIQNFNTNIVSTTAAADLTPVLMESPLPPGWVVEQFSDGSALTNTSAGTVNSINLGYAAYQKASHSLAKVYSQSAGSVTALAFNTTSDRNAKGGITQINAQDVLARVVALPITKWNFKADAGVCHIGPMAQDFYGAFHVGADDKHIATVDEEGVALAAIQGLNEKLEEKNAEIEQLKSSVAELKALVLHSGTPALK